jgi:hypothetical protein
VTVDGPERFDRRAERRAALQRDLETIVAAEDAARLDRQSIGFPDGGGVGAGASGTSTTEAAAMQLVEHPDPAGRWLTAARHAMIELTRLANEARSRWSPPATGTLLGGEMVGARTSHVEMCAGCQLPIMGGSADPLKRLDGDPFHGRAGPGHGWCYHAALRSRGRLGGGRR